MHSRIFLNYQPDCQLLQIILLLWKRRPFLIYVINISKYLDSDIKFGFMGNQVYWGNGAATLAVLPNSTTPHIPINRTSVSLANCGRRLWAPRKRAGYQTTNILAEVKILMCHVKIGQDLCAPTLWQVFPISVTCGYIYITAQNSALPPVPASVHITRWSQHKLDLFWMKAKYNNCTKASFDTPQSLKGSYETVGK